MNILKKHAAQHGYNYQNLLKDFMDAPEEEQVSFLRQIGGGEDEIMQIVNAYAQATQTAPEEIISALQQLDETQLQQAIQQMAEELQSGQMQTGGIPVTKKGYYELDPNENPFAKIPSGDITMKNIPFEIDAFDGDSGEFLTRMQPEADYQFNAKSVIEKPVMQQGGLITLKEKLKEASSQKKQFLNSREKPQYHTYIEALESAQKELQSLTNRIENAQYEEDKVKLVKKADALLNKALTYTPKNVVRKESTNANYGLVSTPQYTYDVLNPKVDHITIKPQTVAQQNKNINIKGKDKTYNLKWDRDFENTSLFNDQFGNRWRKADKAYTIINSLEPSKPQSNKQKKSAIIVSKTKNIKPLDPVNESDPESLAIAKDIELGVRASRTPIKNDFLNLGDSQLPISKDMNTRLANRMATELTQKEESESVENSDVKTFSHKSNNFLRNMLLGNQVAKAFQPTAPVFRRHIEMDAPELPELDMTGYIDEIQNQFQLAQKNINPNSATGMSVLSNMFSNSLDSIRKVVNDVAGKNQQIKATNIGTRLNTINQEQKINQDYDYEAYNTHLQDLAARDALKTTAFNSLMKAKAQDNQDAALLDMIPALYPYIEEISPTVKDKIFKQRKFKLNSNNFNLPQI